jgi:TfoX N-terminal domain
MAYDEGVAQRVREGLADQEEFVEKRMFGGLCFMVGGHMCCGVTDGDLMARVGPDQYEAALTDPHARKMDFTGKPLKGFVYVEQEGFEADADLEAWITRCRTFVNSLPPK